MSVLWFIIAYVWIVVVCGVGYIPRLVLIFLLWTSLLCLALNSIPICCWTLFKLSCWVYLWWAATRSQLYGPWPVQWHFRLTHIMASVSVFCNGILDLSGIGNLCWYAGFCIHFVWPIVNNNHLSPTRWQFLFGSWVWMSLSLLLPTLTLGAGSCWLLLSTPCCSVCSCVVTELPLLFFMPSFALCWAQWSGSQLYALFSFVPDSYWSLFLRLVSCWNETWICCVLRTKELCITSLFDFWPPQSPDVFPLVYDDDFLWQSSSETTSLHPSWYITVKLL